MSKLTKKLEWREVEEGWYAVNRGDEQLYSPVPPYEVRITSRGEVRVRGFASLNRFETFDGSVEQAKAACHDHFERLVTEWLV
jgi:hypothetical protein